MPISPTGAITYNATFQAAGNTYGFDVNVSGYAEDNPATFTARAIPWSTLGQYSVVIQSGGFNPITRTYQATVYRESDYFNIRLVVGQQGILTTSREGSAPATNMLAVLTGVRRGNYQYPAWPAVGVGDGKDVQTIVLEFVMLQQQ